MKKALSGLQGLLDMADDERRNAGAAERFQNR